MASDDQRSEYRLQEAVTVFVETFSSPAGEDRPVNNIVVSKTIDLSANGVQVVMDKPVPIGSLLQLCVEISDSDERFHLAGEVMWLTETDESTSYLVGFKVLESDQTHVREWKEYICQRLHEDDDGNIDVSSFL